MKNEKKKNEKKRSPLRWLPFDFVRITAAPGLLWFRPKIIYENENAKKKIRGGALLISNHIGLFDPMYLMMAIWYRRHRFICKNTGAGVSDPLPGVDGPYFAINIAVAEDYDGTGVIKRKHFYSRLVVALGEPFDVTARYGARPKFSQLDEAAALLYEKDLLLAQLASRERN